MKPEQTQGIMEALGSHMEAMRGHMGQALQVQEALHHNAMAQMHDAVKALSAPKRIIRDANGRVSGIEPAVQPSTGDT